VELAHHNVFFGWDPASEFGEIKKGRVPIDPTLYVCAQDRGTGVTAPALERFEIIENAAPGVDVAKEEKQQCRTRVFEHLAERGLVFTPRPDTPALTVPGEFHQLFPASQGSLYGLSPHGMMAAFKRPTARTALPGLYLAGGGAHPGAGIAMATLSGKHAAGAILKDLASPSTSPKTDTRGGTSTESRMTGLKPSRS
jgi:1-hydroxycarotenoid 3,4-desaturase